MTKREMSPHARCAKEIRQFLKKREIKASVISESFSGGNSVNIVFTDLNPKTFECIKKELEIFQYGTFNGMNDCYECDNLNENISQVKFLSVENRMSDKTIENIDEFILKNKLLKNLSDKECEEKFQIPIYSLRRKIYNENYEKVVSKNKNKGA